MKLVVYTTVFGKTDPLREPLGDFPGVDFVCFTNRDDIKSKRWRIERLGNGDGLTGNHVFDARHWKIMSHEEFPDADATLWLDAAYELKIDPRDIADQYLWRHDALAFAHPDRNNIQQEGEILISMGLVPKQLIDAQLNYYAMTDYSYLLKAKCLTTTGFLMRKNTHAIKGFNLVWWNEVQNRHCRDQMSVDFAAAQGVTDIHYLPGNYRDNPFANWQKFQPQ